MIKEKYDLFDENPEKVKEKLSRDIMILEAKVCVVQAELDDLLIALAVKKMVLDCLQNDVLEELFND